ncbi:hypothetical protein F0562_008746 [Nyssa sinensis]|uniref:Wax synthase domain-containing protein n=1 Tax=Nyssa sinensis TaxID=561372 RepID=A0A5J5A7F3_9ASTE|nr:hypothetical protein F0562_008746 [Nyssa sinensis]
MAISYSFSLLLLFHFFKAPQRERIHQKIILVVYCCLVFLMVELLMSFSSALVRVLVGLELEPASDEPYLATSLQDFWGRRWNLMVTNILRHTVYKPVSSALAAVIGSQWAPLPAVLASFVVSGLMHELCLYYLTRATPTWDMTWFFVLHGVCVVVEMGLKEGVNRQVAAALGRVWATNSWVRDGHRYLAILSTTNDDRCRCENHRRVSTFYGVYEKKYEIKGFYRLKADTIFYTAVKLFSQLFIQL